MAMGAYLAYIALLLERCKHVGMECYITLSLIRRFSAYTRAGANVLCTITSTLTTRMENKRI
jgi:hypothetical protein